jgi:glycosyltransferase involved in cell wall biosynthesis
VNKPKYSVVIPVYNRPDEVRELLDSLVDQRRKDFEVIIVEDGSTMVCEPIVLEYSARLPVRYYFKPNSGPGPSRNFGFAHAEGEYFVVFDSDCTLPPGYFDAVETAMQETAMDAWGGPDKAHHDFTVQQRAMGYTMSSFLTTGGIRGAKQRVGWFQPRSFNMGISRKVFEVTGGFKFSRFAEDIELSIRMKKAGFRIGLIQDAFVYHKRRTSFVQFFSQVFNFGKGRVLVGTVHPEEVKIAHWFPSIFTFATIAMPILYFTSGMFFKIGGAIFGSYLLLIFLHSLIVSRSPVVAGLSVPSALLQLWGYGTGFISEKIKARRSARVGKGA